MMLPYSTRFTTRHDLADAVLVFVILPLALGIADLLDDHLLGVLGSDAAEIDGRQRLVDEVADGRRDFYGGHRPA